MFILARKIRHMLAKVIIMVIATGGILSEHALELARLTEKRLGTSKFSNSIFERFRWVFDLVFSSNKFLLIY